MKKRSSLLLGVKRVVVSRRPANESKGKTEPPSFAPPPPPHTHSRGVHGFALMDFPTSSLNTRTPW